MFESPPRPTAGHRLHHAILLLLLLAVATPGQAEQPTLSFGIVPQTSATRLAVQWIPLLQAVGERAGVSLHFETAPNIDSFERRLAAGAYDVAYMNPYHYTVFSQRPGYRALVNARDRKIRGIIVVAKESPIRSIDELAGEPLAFPSPGAFAASILTRSELRRRDIAFHPTYVSSHDSVYANVAHGLYSAGGGIHRTFNAQPAETRARLRILWETAGYTPHAVAVHPRVPVELAARLRTAMVELAESEPGRMLLAPLKIRGWQRADDPAWDDVRALDIDLLDYLLDP